MIKKDGVLSLEKSFSSYETSFTFVVVASFNLNLAIPNNDILREYMVSSSYLNEK